MDRENNTDAIIQNKAFITPGKVAASRNRQRDSSLVQYLIEYSGVNRYTIYAITLPTFILPYIAACCPYRNPYSIIYEPIQSSYLMDTFTNPDYIPFTWNSISCGPL